MRNEKFVFPQIPNIKKIHTLNKLYIKFVIILVPFAELRDNSTFLSRRR